MEKVERMENASMGWILFPMSVKVAIVEEAKRRGAIQ